MDGRRAKIFSVSSEMPTIGDILLSYEDYLALVNPAAHALFVSRKKSDAEGARVEAITFAMLRTNGYNPDLKEDTSSGGVDFVCNPNSREEFVVEATHLEDDAIERVSGMKNEISSGRFSFVTSLLRQKASAKAKQLSNYRCPRVLVIGSTHTMAPLLFDHMAVEWLSSSEPAISVPIGEPDPNVSEVTDLKESLFFRPDGKGGIEPCRQSISAVLLSMIGRDGECIVYGALHPDAARPLPTNRLRDIPFARVHPWPPKDGLIQVEWVVSSPTACRMQVDPVTLTETELRRGPG